MKNAMAAILALLAWAGLAGAPAFAIETKSAPAPAEQASLLESDAGLVASRRVILRHDPQASDLRVPPPEIADPVQKGLALPKATIAVNYLPAGAGQNGDSCITWPEQAKAAFTYAVNIWGALLQSSVPITMDACWANNMESGVLGSAGPRNFFRNFSGAPVANTWYPVALANSLAGTDLDTARADLYAAFNSSFTWYFGTDGRTPSSQVDFASVILHEVGHGLGFLGSMQVASGQGSWGQGSGAPFIYDRYTENGAGQALLNTTAFPNPSSALAAQLQGNSVFFDGPFANAANGGARVPLYAPASWQQGSSYSHLGESYRNTANALMLFSLANGAAIHDPGPVALGIFRDSGWQVQSAGATYALTIARAGAGTGTVTSSPAGINCGTACSAEFSASTPVTLTATAASGSSFSGWSGGGCSGTGTCTLTLGAATSVTATFAVSPFCTYTLSPTEQAVAAIETAGSFTVTTATGCSWSASSSQTWITTSSSGSGSGIVNYTVAANAGTAPRTGTIAAGGQTFTITQATATPSTRNLLANGDFEAGATAWQQVAAFSTIITKGAASAHAGEWYAWLGGYDNAADTLYQDFEVPAGIESASLRFWYRISTQETSSAANDQLVVTIRGLSAGAVPVTLATFSNLTATSGWLQSAAVDVSAFKGQTVRLQFAATTNAAGVTNFLVDDVTLNASFPAAASSPRLVNIATRSRVQTGDNVMIGGFIVGGSAAKKVLIRARGPSLAALGVPGVLANPVLALYAGQTVIASNDDWASAANAADVRVLSLAPTDPLESAILTTLNPGGYTVIVSGAQGATGIAIVEVFEMEGPEVPLVNIATRARVETGDNVMIAGFIVGGDTPRTVLVRARGPSLSALGVPGVLANPALALYSGQTVVASNDDWLANANVGAIQATGLAPSNVLESALLLTLNPGAYTAIVSGSGGATGVAIVEVFAQ